MEGEMYWHDSGTGTAVLFLHAFPLDASQWDHQVAALSGHYRCLRPDMYGCGLSPPPPQGTSPSMDDLAGELLAALDKRGVERFAVVGNSLGGYLAFALYARAPQRITALALLNTRVAADTEEKQQHRRAMAHAVRTDGVEAIVEPTVSGGLGRVALAEAHISDPLRGRVRRTTVAGVLALLEALAGRPDRTAMVEGIVAPTLVVCGSEDRNSPSHQVQEWAARIPGARMEIIEGSGHHPNLEKPEQVNALLLGFLDATGGE